MRRWEFFYTLAEKFNNMIKPLQKYDDESVYNNSEPLLDYVRDFSNNYWKNRYFLSFEKDSEDLNTSVSPFPSTFAKRLNDNKIQRFRLNEYQKAVAEFKPKRHVPIKELDNDQHTNAQQKSSDEDYNISLTLRAFNLDASKFWYLCLMLKDYIEGTANESALHEVTVSFRELIINLIVLLDQIEYHKNDGIFISSGANEFRLSLQKREKSNLKFQDLFIINDTHTLKIIKLALEFFLEAHKEESEILDFIALEQIMSLLKNYKHKKKRILRAQMALFHRYLKWFLDKQEVNKEYVNNSKYSVSISKNLLISRMSYFTGLTDDIKYLGDHLRSDISKYEGVEDDILNLRYEFPESIQNFVTSAIKKGR